MVERSKADKLQSSLHMIDFPKQNQHVFFISDPKEAKDISVLGKRAKREEDGLGDDEDVV